MWVKSILLAVVVAALATTVAVLTGRGAVSVAGAPVTVWALVIAFLVNWAAFVPAALRQTERFYDATGTAAFLGIAALAANAAEGDWRRWVPAVLVAVWTLRLGTFLVRRIHRAGKDERFDEMKRVPARFFVAWTLQGLWVFLTSLPAVVLAASVRTTGLTSFELLGWGVWALGFVLEVMADAQKAAFAADAANRGRFITSGLWAWSRHPNYFGEIVLWAGVFLSGVQLYQGWQWLAVLSPVFVTVLLTKVSGIPLLELRAQARWGQDPAYRAYTERTPVLLPRPPRRAA